MRWVPAVLAVFALSIPGGPLVLQQPQPADWVLRGGAVYTVDAARSWAEAVAVADGKIVYVGTSNLVSHPSWKPRPPVPSPMPISA